MILDERLDEQGNLLALHLRPRDEHWALEEDREVLGPLSAPMLISVMQRYARPVDQDCSEVSDVLDLAEGVRLAVWHYRAPVDLESKRYLILQADGAVPIAVLARQVANALRFVCRKR